MTYCAIDFGTSNSAVAVARPGAAAAAGAGPATALVPLEPAAGERGLTMPTAVFYLAEGPDLQNLPRLFGRAAVEAYVDGVEGRLMRSMKSVLGSALMTQHTDIGAGRSVSFGDVIAGYLLHLKRAAEAAVGGPVEQVVLGRPVFFVDDDPARDAAAQAALAQAAQAVGFRDVRFQFEPIAAAFHYEQGVAAEERVLVADIGGGTSDFSVVRVGPARAGRPERRDDILASHGVHLAGTDFDRRVSLARLMPALGFGAHGPARPGRPAREVPSKVYHDLATWHLINTVYRPQRMGELQAMRDDYADPAHHRRLMTVLRERLGHALAGRAEVEATHVMEALTHDIHRIVATALETARLAGLGPGDVDALYFTGGSTGLAPLAEQLAQAFPAARPVHGDRFASVATGLGLEAQRQFGTTPVR